MKEQDTVGEERKLDLDSTVRCSVCGGTEVEWMEWRRNNGLTGERSGDWADLAETGESWCATCRRATVLEDGEFASDATRR